MKRQPLLLRYLAVSVLLMVVLHVCWQLIGRAVGADNRVVTDIVGRFGLDNEMSIPTWLSSIMAMMFAGLCWHIGLNSKGRASHPWYFLFFAGLFISIDEVASLHELLLQGLHILADFGEGRQTLLDNAWLLLVPFIGIGAILGARYLYKHLPSDTLKQIIVAASVYLLGALVIEYLSIPMDKSKLAYSLGEVIVEETLEFVGIWLLIRAALVHMNRHEAVVRKNLSDLF